MFIIMWFLVFRIFGGSLLMFVIVWVFVLVWW